MRTSKTRTEIICNFSAAGLDREIDRESKVPAIPEPIPNPKFHASRHQTPPRTTTTTTTTAIVPSFSPLVQAQKLSKQKNKILKIRKESMRHSVLRSVRALRTTAPRRLASSSSSPAGNDAAAAAQKKAQDAFGAASAAAVRAGAFARSALGPLGTRLSGLLGCTFP